MARSGPTTTSSRRLALQGPTAGGADEIHGGSAHDEIHGGQRARTRSMVSGTVEIHGGRRWAAPAAGGGRRHRATRWQQATSLVAELRQRMTALGSSTAAGSDVGQLDGDGRRSRGPAADVDARQLDGDGRRC